MSKRESKVVASGDGMTIRADKALQDCRDVLDEVNPLTKCQRDLAAANAELTELSTEDAILNTSLKRLREEFLSRGDLLQKIMGTHPTHAEQSVLSAAQDYARADMPSDGTKKALLDACRIDLRREIKR